MLSLVLCAVLGADLPPIPWSDVPRAVADHEQRIAALEGSSPKRSAPGIDQLLADLQDAEARKARAAEDLAAILQERERETQAVKDTLAKLGTVKQSKPCPAGKCSDCNCTDADHCGCRQQTVAASQPEVVYQRTGDVVSYPVSYPAYSQPVTRSYVMRGGRRFMRVCTPDGRCTSVRVD